MVLVILIASTQAHLVMNMLPRYVVNDASVITIINFSLYVVFMEHPFCAFGKQAKGNEMGSRFGSLLSL